MQTTRRWSLEVIEIGDQIASLSTAKAGQLVAYLETVHGIQAVTPLEIRREKVLETTVEPPAPARFAVVLEGCDALQRINLIRALRECFSLGIKEARDWVEAVPKTLREDVPQDAADKLKTRLEAAGAKISLWSAS